MSHRQIDVYYTSSLVLGGARFFRTDPFVNITVGKLAWGIGLANGRQDYKPTVFHVAMSRQLPADETLEQAGVNENDVLLMLELPSGVSASSIVDQKMPTRIEGELPPAIRQKAREGGFTLDELDDARERQQRAISMTFTNSPVGVINLGEVQGNIQATVEALAGRGGRHQEVAAAIKELADAISKSSLVDAQKKEALDVVETIASQVDGPPEKRSAGILKAMLGGFPAMISTAKAVVELWGKYGPLITGHLGL